MKTRERRKLLRKNEILQVITIWVCRLVAYRDLKTSAMPLCYTRPCQINLSNFLLTRKIKLTEIIFSFVPNLVHLKLQMDFCMLSNVVFPVWIADGNKS